MSKNPIPRLCVGGGMSTTNGTEWIAFAGGQKDVNRFPWPERAHERRLKKSFYKNPPHGTIVRSGATSGVATGIMTSNANRRGGFFPVKRELVFPISQARHGANKDATKCGCRRGGPRLRGINFSDLRRWPPVRNHGCRLHEPPDLQTKPISNCFR